MDLPEFYRTLWGKCPVDHIVNLRFIPEGEGYPINKWAHVGSIINATETTVAWLQKQNETHHIYHRVSISAEQADRKAAITYTPALWVDVDDNSTEAYERLQDMAMPPTMVVKSGGGYHGYWLLNEPLYVSDSDTLERIERVNQGLAVACKGDESVTNINRILRTPSTRNIKAKYDSKPVVEIVYCDTDRYTFSMLWQQYAPLGAPPAPKVRRYVPTEAIDNTLPRWVHNYIQYGAPRGERNNKLYAAARAYLDCGLTRFQAETDLVSRAAADGLSQEEINRTISSAFMATRNPDVNKTMNARYALGDARRQS